MKKITIILFLLTVNFSMSQTWTTGEVQLRTGYSVQFDIDQAGGVVTMTMIGPDNQWLGVGPGIATGNGMGDLGDDAIIYNANGLEDRRMPAGVGAPQLDAASQDWTVLSNDVTAGVRTLVAARDVSTGDPEDFVFPTTAGALPILWALGPSLAFPERHSSRGGVVAGVVLSTPEFENALSNIIIAPNPAINNLNIKLPDFLTNKELEIEVYDVLGKKILRNNLNTFKPSINVSNWDSGLYLVRITSEQENTSVTKRFIKF